MTIDEVFILRFWLEEVGARDELQWRAQVKSVNSQERHVAGSVDAAFELIVGRLRATQSVKDEYPK